MFSVHRVKYCAEKDRANSFSALLISDKHMHGISLIIVGVFYADTLKINNLLKNNSVTQIFKYEVEYLCNYL